MSLVDLLSTDPGTFVYHILVLLALEAMAGIALVEWRRTHASAHRRVLWSFGGLLALRVLLLIGEPGGPTIIAPLLSSIEVISLTLLGWAFLTPALNRRAGRTYLVGGFGVALLCVGTFLPGWYRTLAKIPNLLYIAFWQQPFWHATNMLLTLTPLLLLLRLPRQERPTLSILGFTILFLGFTTLFLGSLLVTLGRLTMYAYTLIGTGRLISMVGYPLFAIAVHRISPQSTQGRSGEAQQGHWRAAVLESLTEGVIASDQKGRVVTVNAAAERILSIPRRRLLGRSLERLTDRIPLTPKANWRTIAQVDSPVQMTFELKGKVIHVRATPVLTATGGYAGTVATLREASETN
jgi:PAS domain S-box-containing protein